MGKTHVVFVHVERDQLFQRADRVERVQVEPLVLDRSPPRFDEHKDSHHPRYTPLDKVDDTAIKEVGIKRFADDNSNVDWLDPAEDRSARSLEDSRSEHG